MTKYTKRLDGGLHSRLKNDLLENQRWWPITVKSSSGTPHLTVDPVLFASDIQPHEELLLEAGMETANESEIPGIRVEYLTTNASKTAVSGSEGNCTLTISHSGTWSAFCDITFPDGTVYGVPLVSESRMGKFSDILHAEALEELDNRDRTVGPSPVPMTLQELADFIDSFTKQDGAFAAETPAGRTWNPHPNAHEHYRSDTGADTETPVDYTGIAVDSNYLGSESNAQLAATVFMPMCSNVNQFSRNMNAVTGLTRAYSQGDGHGGTPTSEDIVPLTDGQDMTRYDPDPSGEDSSDISFAFANQFGDHRFGYRAFGSAQHKTLSAVYAADNGLAPNPKWRMRMCLAMFLKNGTYTISNGGALIPYVYDPRREIGGEQFKRVRGEHAKYGTYLGGAGLYGYWSPNGRASQSTLASTYGNAMISPGIDFVQGPFSSAAIAWNFNYSDFSSMVGKEMHDGYTWYAYLRKYLEGYHALNVCPVAVYGIELDAASNLLTIYVDEDLFQTSDSISAGHPLYITGLEGDLGWDTTVGQDCNGWWKLQNVIAGFTDSDAPSGTGRKFQFTCGFSTTVAKYDPGAGARVRQGRPQPEWIVSDDKLPVDHGHWLNGGETPGQRSLTPSVFGTVDDLIPGIEDHSSTVSTVKGYDETDRLNSHQRRPIHITGSVTNFATATADAIYPTPSMSGGVGIRIPPQLGDPGNLGERVPGGTWANIEWDMWFTKGILLSLWSGMDQETGRHAWDHITPSDSAGNTWPAGRNRPWPGRLRADTRWAAQPSLVELQDSYSDTALDDFNDNPLAFAPTDKVGLTEWGVSPVYADIEITAHIPLEEDRCTKIWFDRGTRQWDKHGLRSMVNTGSSACTDMGAGGRSSWPGGWGHYPVNDQGINATVDTVYRRWNRNAFTHSDPWWWAWGGSSILEDSNVITAIRDGGGSQPYNGLRTGWGNAANHIGSGGSSSAFEEGMHTLRFAFFDDRLVHLQNGDSKGSDSSSAGPVVGFTFEHGAYHTMDNAITNGVYANLVNPTGKDPMVDSIKVREIPTPQMLPFKAETVTYNFANVVQYRELFIVGGNIDIDQFVRVSICAPGSTTGAWDGFGQAPGTPFAGFEDLDPEWVGGYGSVSLVDLPASVYTDGFTIRYEFTTADVQSGSKGAIDWSKMPYINEWSIDYDLKPVATLTVTGETYNGDTTSPIDTRVGHIVSYNVAGSTPDSYRTITDVKFDYGDGIVTEWLPITSPADAISYDTNHSYGSTATGLNARAKVRDDNGNESDWSALITINVENAPPVAVLKATPSLIRAGDSVRLDGSRSYDIEAGGSVTDFTFTPGDGSSAIGPQSTSYANHTYATAGEYMATLTCVDGSSAVSNTAQAVIKVLPARHTIPLVLNTMPSSFQRERTADYTATSVLDTDYPEISDSGNRSDEFRLSGTFLHATAELDIDFMEDLLQTGHLVEFEWMRVNYVGTPDSRTFVGRVVAFSYNRQGGAVGQTPWSATLVREAGVGE